ncbi:hypothetical protein GCM10011495_20870 [Hymenobacter frigidus]|uniref:Uncharacterized protein n=1 Tax=Hymenobacter frigidus TaxID=1524095 RepID=A0ABQ2A5J9_9BACT|nr:hypothetical protein GCM10011495_20870 [Hymenobacter frigidus]
MAAGISKNTAVAFNTPHCYAKEPRLMGVALQFIYSFSNALLVGNYHIIGLAITDETIISKD